MSPAKMGGKVLGKSSFKKKTFSNRYLWRIRSRRWSNRQRNDGPVRELQRPSMSPTQTVPRTERPLPFRAQITCRHEEQTTDHGQGHQPASTEDGVIRKHRRRTP